MGDIILEILFIIVLLSWAFAFATLSVRNNEKTKQKDINNIKKQAFREFANRLKTKSLTKRNYNDWVNVKEIDKTLIELIRGIK